MLNYTRKSIKMLLIVLVLLFLFASTASASTFVVKDVYYENSEGNIVRIDYEKALEDVHGFPAGDSTLYDATVDAVRDAISDFRTVWVKVIIDGEEIVIDHSAALLEGRSLKQSVTDTDADYYDVGEPDYTYELVMEDGVAIEKAVGELALIDAIVVVYDEVGEQWLVYVTLSEEDLPDGYAVENVAEVLIKGENAAVMPATGNTVWQLQVEDKEYFWEDDPVVNEEDIIIVMNDGTEYTFGN